MSLLNKYVQKYGNYDQVKRLQKSKDWLPQTPSSAEKESNVADAHDYIDNMSDEERKRILSNGLGKSAGSQNALSIGIGFGKQAEKEQSEYKNYRAAESILQNEEYEKRREDVVRKNGSYAYKTMKNYIDLIDKARESQSGGGTIGALVGAKESKDLRNQAAEIKKALNQMGISGKDFDKYEQYVREYKDIESTQAMEKDIAMKIDGKPISRGIGYTAADVLVSPVTGFMATAESLKRPFYADPSAPVNIYSDLYRLQNATEAVEKNVSDKIDSKFGKFVYGAGVSTLKSAEAMAIGGALSNAFGIDAASKLGQLITLPMFGASAYASTLADAQKKGFSAELATEKALAAGISEMLFEELSLDKAWGTIKNAKEGVGGFAKRLLDVFMGAGIEGSEEIFTYLANHIADNFINGDFSDYQSGIRMRVRDGMSLNQATREAKKEFIAQLVESGLAGVASGLAMNAGGAFVGRVQHKKTAKNINANTELKREVVESAKGLDGTTAAEIANKKKIEEITENDMVEIIHSMEEVSGKSAHDIAKESLVKLGESEEEAEKKASEIVEAVNQVEPTEEQEAKNTKLVEDEKVAEAYTDVLKNRVAQNALSDVYENNKKVKQRRSGGVTALSNGNKIKVYDFEDVNKGIVNTSVGTMSLDSVQMAENERRLFKTAYVFENNNASNAYVNGYKGQNISDYSNAAMRAYTVGASGASFESFMNDPRNASIIASVDNNAFLQEMYFHGQNMIKTEEVARVDKSAKEESKATTQSDLQNVFNEVAKVFNLNISETATGEESGSFIPSSLKLTLNQNESKNLYQTLHHELMEYSKAYAPKEYNELKNAIMDFATQKLGSSKIKMHLEIYRDTYRGFGARSGNESEAKKTLADATDEYVNDFVAQVMSTDEGVNQFVGYLADNSDLTEQQKTGIVQSLKDFIQKLIDSIKAFISKHTGMNLGASDAKALTQYAEDLAKIRDKIQSAWDASRATVTEQLNSVGFEADTVTNTVASNSVRTTIAESWKELGYKSYDEAIHEMAKNITDQMVAKTESKKVYDEFYEKALKWVIAEESVANFILGSEENQEYLDYVADDRYKAIKDNSDYDQGTFDLSNLCRKREIFTKMFDNLQKEYPDHLFTAAEIATVREVLRQSHMEVACALCYVEDRRQHMGEAANEFVEQYKIALKNPSKVIMYKNSKGELKPLKVTEEQSKQYGYKQGSTYKAEDKYVPTQYDLVTYQGFKDLEINHPEVAHAFVRYNNARGQNSARLVEGHAEYKREVLDYTADRVKKINDLGGLRIFSFSDLEGIHVIDLMQVITDSATKGLMIQSYTKVPAYAAIVKDTGIKLNRSLIPATRKSEKAYAFIDGKWENVTGKVKEEGIATVDGKEYIAVDIVEGIDVTDKYFYNDDNPNIGNILIGVTDKQIALAMLDPNIDYIIPFHTGQADDILQAKGIVGWDNYKDYQTEKKLPGHIKKAKGLELWDKEAINIYTDVINKYNVKNKDEFVKYFLKECKDNHLKPRFEQFAYNEDGSIREGYYKFLLDYKLFDRNGNILKQQPVLPTFDEKTLKLVNEFLTEDKERSKNLKFSEDITNTIKKELGLDKKVKKAHSLNVDSEGKTLTEDQAKFFADSKARDENGNLLVMYHGTFNDFTVFDEEKANEDSWRGAGFYFTNSESEAKETYASLKGGDSQDKLDIRASQILEEWGYTWEGDIEYPTKYDTHKLYGPDSWEKVPADKGKKLYEKAIAEAKKDFKSGKVMKVYLNIKNPYIVPKNNTKNTWTITQEVYEGKHDGIIDYSVSKEFNLNKDVLHITVFKANQIKSVDNEHPTNNEDIRYSLNVDSEGRELTQDQVKFFTESEIRDNENRLKQMYHGTNDPIFTVFDPEYSDDKLSLFFSDDPFISSTYVVGQKDRKVTPGAEKKEDIENEEQAIEWLKERGFDNFEIEEIENPFGSSYSAWTFTDSNGTIYTVSEDGGEGLVDYVKDKQQYEEGGGLYHVYLNIKNPYIIDAEGHNWNDIFMPEQSVDKDLMKKVNRFLKLLKDNVDRSYGIGDVADSLGALKESTDYAIENFDIDDDVADEISKLAAEIDDIYENWDEEAHLDEDNDPTPMRIYILFNEERPRTTRYIARWAYNHGYDGVYIKNVIDIGGYAHYEKHPSNIAIAFESNQVKSVDNIHPTEDEDIRFSLEVEDWDKLFSEMTEVKESNRILTEGLKSINNVKLNDKITNKIASEIKSEYKSRIDKKVLAESLQRVFSYMLDTGSPSYGDLAEIMREVAMPVIEQTTEVMPEEKRMYDAFKENMKGYRIKLNSQQKAEVAKTFGSYYAFKNALFGNVIFSESGSELDSIWQSVVEASNGMLDIGTSDANQPMALYEFIQGLKPSYSNIYGADQEEAAYDVALSIFRKFLLEQEYENNPKLRQEALKLNEAHQKYRQTLKKNSDKRIKEEMAKIKMERDINIKRLIKEINQLNEDESNVIKGSIEQAFIVKQKQEYERRLKRLREYKNEQMDRKLAELRAQQKDSQTKRIQSRQITQAKAKIRKNIETLNSMLAHGTEKRHIPVNMVRATIEMLEAIDINTGNSKSLAAYLEKMDNIYTGLKGAEAYAFDYDARTSETIKTLKKMFEGRNYTMLSLDELNQVVDITKQLVTQITNANKLMFEQKRLDAIDFSKQAIKEVRNAKHIDNAFMNALDKYLTPHLNAYREFRKISGYTDGAIMQLYNDLDKGQLKQLQVMKDINALFDDVLKDTKEVKKFTSTDEKDLVNSGLKDEKGNPVMITKAQRMALIMSSYNDKNMEHITYGGVKIPDLTKKKREDALAKGKTYWYESPIEIRDAIYAEDADKLKLITERASMKVKELEKGLSPWEKEFLEKVKEMFWHKTGTMINKTSLELKGYALARVNKYFPIISDKNFVNQDVGGLIQDGTLEGWGNLKERKFGRNAIVLEDITDTILRQTNDVAKYVGLVVPIRNLNVAWNTNVYDITTAKRDTLINAIDQAWGANNKKYIENLIKDMTSRRDGGDSTFLDALRGRFAGAVLTLNPSVAIKQSASYFTAGAIVGNKTLAKTVKDIGKGFITKKGIPELEAINPLLWYRNQGNATQELADMKRTGFGKNLPTWAQKAINWVEFMDTGTIRTLEYAAKNYVDDHYIGKNKLEGKEYWEKVSEVFTKIVEETQPNYTPLQQADIIRNPNKALKLLVMFKTQPLQNMGVLYDSIGELRAKVKADDQDGIKSAKKKVARAIVSQIQSAMTFSMMTILADLLLHKFYKYKDDDDEFSWEKVLAKFGAGITDSFWGMLLFGQDAYKAVDSFLNGEDVNGLNVSFLDNLANFANAIRKLVDESQKRMDAVTEEDRQKYDNGIILDTGNVLNYFGQIAGVPIGNLKNMAESLILYAMDVRDGKIGENDFSRDVDSQNERMYEALLADDSERYHKLFDEAVLKKTNKGTDQDKAEESVTSGIKKLIQKGYDSGQLTFDEAFTILTKEMGMDETDAYFKLDEWLYKSEGNDSYSKYSRMIDAINDALETDDRKGILEEIQKLKDNKVDDKNIQSMITKEFKPKYLELKAQNKSATIRSILISAYMATGLSRDDAEKRIDNWK